MLYFEMQLVDIWTDNWTYRFSKRSKSWKWVITFSMGEKKGWDFHFQNQGCPEYLPQIYNYNEICTFLKTSLVLEGLCSACFPTIPALPTSDYLDRVSSANQKLYVQRVTLESLLSLCSWSSYDPRGSVKTDQNSHNKFLTEKLENIEIHSFR